MRVPRRELEDPIGCEQQAVAREQPSLSGTKTSAPRQIQRPPRALELSRVCTVCQQRVRKRARIPVHEAARLQVDHRVEHRHVLRYRKRLKICIEAFEQLQWMPDGLVSA